MILVTKGIAPIYVKYTLSY